jgi:hypothetical protein
VRTRELRTFDATNACPFAPRCPHAIDICRSARPPLEPAAGDTLVACHRWRELHDGAATNGSLPAGVVHTPAAG